MIRKAGGATSGSKVTRWGRENWDTGVGISWHWGLEGTVARDGGVGLQGFPGFCFYLSFLCKTQLPLRGIW